MTTWRDGIMLHPATNLFPTMSDTELDELAADIAEHGLQEPIFWLGGQLLDGRNRVAAIERIRDQHRREEFQARIAEPQNGKILPDSVDPYAYVVSANMHRRHLTAEQKRELVANLIKANPRKSDRQIAAEVGSNRTTAGVVRRELEEAGHVSKIDTRIDSQGRQQPASKPERAVAQSVKLDRDSAIVEFGKLLHAKPRDALDDLARLLHGEQARIETLPMSVRVELARNYLDALNVGIDDLRSAQFAAE